MTLYLFVIELNWYIDIDLVNKIVIECVGLQCAKHVRNQAPINSRHDRRK